jgi:hypothetical protein
VLIAAAEAGRARGAEPAAVLYRGLDSGTSTAAEAIGVPRVSIQDALRAMVRAADTNVSIGNR